jgi:hypothetical protein
MSATDPVRNGSPSGSDVELNPLVTARSSAEEALAAAAADFDVELPERPGPVLDDPADRWLFADERRRLDSSTRTGAGGPSRLMATRPTSDR